MPTNCSCCGCVLEDDYGTSTVSGDGSHADPYTVTRVDPAFVRPAVRITRAGALASVPNGTVTNVPFTAEVFDTNNMWVVGTPERITFQTAGIYSFGFSWIWPSNTTGKRLGYVIYFPISGGSSTLIDEEVQTTTGDLRRQLNYQWYFSVGDYIRLDVAQQSGGALNLSSAIGWAVYHGRKVS